MENNQKYIEIVKYFIKNECIKDYISLNKGIIYDGVLYVIDYYERWTFSGTTYELLKKIKVNLSIVIKEDLNYRKKTLFRCNGEYKSIGFLDFPDYGIDDEFIDKYF